MRPGVSRETATGSLITQRSQVRILSPLLGKTAPGELSGGRFHARCDAPSTPIRLPTLRRTPPRRSGDPPTAATPPAAGARPRPGRELRRGADRVPILRTPLGGS